MGAILSGEALLRLHFTEEELYGNRCRPSIEDSFQTHWPRVLNFHPLLLLI